MRITESQLRRIVREELNEMRKSGITLRVNPETGEYEESGLEDFPGAGAERARYQKASQHMFRRPKITDPDLGDKFERMMASLDLDEPGEYLPSMFTGTAADNVARFNDEISSKLPMKGSMFKPARGSVKTDDFVGTYEIKRVPGEPELFEASVMTVDDPDTEAGVASADTPYEAVMNAVENASYGRGSPFYGSF